MTTSSSYRTIIRCQRSTDQQLLSFVYVAFRNMPVYRGNELLALGPTPKMKHGFSGLLTDIFVLNFQIREVFSSPPSLKLHLVLPW